MNITTVVSPTIIKTTAKNTNRTNGVANNLTPQTQDAVNLNTNQRAGSLEEDLESTIKTESRDLARELKKEIEASTIAGCTINAYIALGALGLNQLVELIKDSFKSKPQSTPVVTHRTHRIIQQRSGKGILDSIKDILPKLTAQIKQENLPEKIMESLGAGLGHIKMAQHYFDGASADKTKIKEELPKAKVELTKAIEKLSSVSVGLPPHLSAVVELGILEAMEGLTRTELVYPTTPTLKGIDRFLGKPLAKLLLPKDGVEKPAKLGILRGMLLYKNSFSERAFAKTILTRIKQDITCSREQYERMEKGTGLQERWLKRYLSSIATPPAPYIKPIDSIQKGKLYDQATKVLKLVDQSTDLAGSGYAQFFPADRRHDPIPLIKDPNPDCSTIVANGQKGIHITFKPGDWGISSDRAHHLHPELIEIQQGTTS